MLTRIVRSICYRIFLSTCMFDTLVLAPLAPDTPVRLLANVLLNLVQRIGVRATRVDVEYA